MLSHFRITAAKPAEKPYTLLDGKGLKLVIQPSGSKLWRLNYRHFDRQKVLHLGPWPEVGLADARVKRDEARAQIAAGVDPAVEKKRARIAAKFAARNTFKDVSLEWLEKCERDGLAPITLDKIRWMLGMAYPLIGSQPISTITPMRRWPFCERSRRMGDMKARGACEACSVACFATVSPRPGAIAT